MECERKRHGSDEPQIRPRWHGDERLVLGQASGWKIINSSSMLKKIITFSFHLPVHRVQHFNRYENRKSHGHGVGIREYLAVDTFEFFSASNASQVMSLRVHVDSLNPFVRFINVRSTYQLIIIHLRSIGTVHEPPSCRSNGSSANITTDRQVSEEKPARDKRFIGFTWGLFRNTSNSLKRPWKKLKRSFDQ